jgi:hypothetical protein
MSQGAGDRLFLLRPHVGDMGMGLFLYDSILLSITRIWAGIYLERHRMGRLLRDIAFPPFSLIFQTRLEPVSLTFTPNKVRILR